MSKQAVDWAESLPTLPTGVKPLLVHLARFARKDTHTCYRAQDVIAESIDQGIRTVERNISWLKEKGLISSKRHYKNGVRVADEITLNVGATSPVNLAGSRPSKCRVTKPTLPVNCDNLTRQLEGGYPSTTTNPSIYKQTNKTNIVTTLTRSPTCKKKIIFCSKKTMISRHRSKHSKTNWLSSKNLRSLQ